jgi:predicted nucleic acid-binding protein
VTLIVDASVAVKWLVDEVDSQAAQRLLDSDEKPVAPDFVLIEVGNVLWKKAQRQQLKPEQAVAGIDALPTYFELLVPSTPLLPRALATAIDVRHPVYDCLYLACAERLEVTLVTAEVRFAAMTRAKLPLLRTVTHTEFGSARD